MRRRRMRRYRPGKENSVMKFVLIFGIILCAVVCGYLTARFALGPIFGYDTEVLKLDIPSKLSASLEARAEKKENSEKKEKEKDDEDDEDQRGYVLQFGVFSSKSGARTLQNQLSKYDIDAEIDEEDGQYKVISKVIAKKEEALKQLEKLKDENNIDVFIDAVD